MMSSKIPCAVMLLVCALKFCATQTSCKGRCGAEYYRGYMCQCDYNCLLYEECCPNYESQCTTQNSCKGRCGESFKRGRLCTCDPDCIKYNQCCSDYKTHCESEDSTLDEDVQDLPMNKGINEDALFPLETTTSQPTGLPSDGYTGIEVEVPVTSPLPDISGDGSPPPDLLDQVPTGPTVDGDISLTQMTASVDDIPVTPSQTPGGQEADTIEPMTPFDQSTFPQPTVAYELYTDNLSVPPTTSVNPSQIPEVTQNIPGEVDVLENVQVSTTSSSDVMILTTIPVETTQSPTIEQNSNDAETSAPSSSTTLEDSSRFSTELSVGATTIPSSTNAVQDGTTGNVMPGESTADPLKYDLKPTEPSPSTPKPEDTPEPSKLQPTTKPEKKPLDTQTTNTDIQADDSDDKNLCSGRPISGVTTLRNGTIAVFRGHYFWFLDSNRVPSPPQSITQVWGVPSPIDTVFTRCNCEGKTFIFKGSRYWRYDNDVLEAGYPKVIKTGFDGLRGHITAALSVPQYRTRREAVFFFKRGGFVQKYSYQAGISQTCGRKVQTPIVTLRSRSARQAVTVLEPAINIRKSWKGFPIQITAAVSVPSLREPEGYKYVVFSRSSTYNVRMSGERPVIAAKENATPQGNSFFKCPKNRH
ncbi:Proteoglycan 4 [Oryzias melastigma]|uniref:Proteoglycan 4 n=1 Tax=Oryzias melastigma TaxID=30732 RepID=A0A834FHT2_ORYME|nr:Proteoglycan 4 [Oryzias melastigma]